MHVMRLLDDNGGILKDGVGPDVFDLRALANKAMTSVRHAHPKHPGLAEMFLHHSDVLSGYVDGSLAEVGNAMKYEATQYVTNAYSSVGSHGPGRVVNVISAARRLYGGAHDAVHRCIEFIEGRGNLPGDLVPQLGAYAKKYRDMYGVKGLHSVPGFVINDLPKRLQAERHRRCLELFWEINRDLRLFRDEAVASGRWRLPGPEDDEPGALVEDVCDPELPGTTPLPGVIGIWSTGEFAALPVSHIVDRHVLIDGDVIKRKVVRPVGPAALDPADITSLFKFDGAARSLQRGWKRAPMFRTDGTALKEIWYMEGAGGTRGPKPVVTTEKCSTSASSPGETPAKSKSRTKKGRAVKNGYDTVIPCGSRRVGDDPGDVIQHYTCERLPNGRAIFHKLTRAARDKLLQPIKRAREARVAKYAKDAVAALSLTRKKTFDIQAFRAYAHARNQHRSALEKAFCSQSARSEKFESQRLLTSQLDRFIITVLDGGPDGRDARKRITYWGEGNGTGSAKVAKRIKTAHWMWAVHLWVDEFGTTKFDCITHEELASAYRRGVGKGGQAGWIRDRDVKFRKSETHTLESRHPCPYPTPLLENTGFRESDLRRWLAVDRDGNAAYAITGLMGVAEDSRPPCYRRAQNPPDA
jgi:uncharacterized membrane protein